MCKNCIKSKRECAGYAQPLVYQQKTQGPPAARHDTNERLVSLQDEGGPSGGFINLQLQPEQQFPGTYHGFDPTAPFAYQNPSFTASYHAVPSVALSELPYTTTLNSGGLYGLQEMQIPPGQPYPETLDTMGRAVPGFPVPNMGASASLFLPLDPQLMDPSMSSNSQSIQAQSQTPVSTLSPDDYRFTQAQQDLFQMHQRAYSLSHPYAIAHDSIDGM